MRSVVSLYKDWIAGIQYVAFISPPGNFSTEHNIELSLCYEDNMRWLSPISFNPYAKLFFTFSGDSPVVLGKVPSFDVELGVVPTWDLHPYEAPVILTLPTWLTVGPADFWVARATSVCFRPGSIPECRSKNFLLNTANGHPARAFNTTI
jgi:hypothetical protein